MPIPKLLSFSMNARACNLATTNWIRISGGFIPPGSAWSPVFHCNSCQSWGATEVHIWRGGGLFLLLTLHVSLRSASHFEVDYQSAPPELPEWGHLAECYHHLDSRPSYCTSISVCLLMLYICWPQKTQLLTAERRIISIIDLSKNQQRFEVFMKWKQKD